jgi:hypothetical protein
MTSVTSHTGYRPGRIPLGEGGQPGACGRVLRQLLAVRVHEDIGIDGNQLRPSIPAYRASRSARLTPGIRCPFLISSRSRNRRAARRGDALAQRFLHDSGECLTFAGGHLLRLTQHMIVDIERQAPHAVLRAAREQHPLARLRAMRPGYCLPWPLRVSTSACRTPHAGCRSHRRGD